MPSKQVTDREKSSRAVATAASKHSGAVADAVALVPADKAHEAGGSPGGPPS